MLVLSSVFIWYSTSALYTIFNQSGDLKIICDRPIVESVNCQFQIFPSFRVASPRVSNYNAVTAVRHERPLKIEDMGAGESEMVDNQILLTTESGYFLAYRDFVFMGDIDNSKSIRLKNMVIKLNLFLLQPQDKLIVLKENIDIDHTHITPLPFLIIIGILGLHIGITVVNISINKTSNKISGSYLSILGLWKYSFNLKEIQAIGVEEYHSKEGTSFSPLIVMRSGKTIDLGSETDRNAAVIKVNLVRDFLGLPTEKIYSS